MSFQLGDVVPLSVTITGIDNTPANAGEVALTVTLPDGTTDITASIAPTETGKYDHDYPTVQAGIHQVRWVATGLNSAAFTDAFTVAPAVGGNFISLADVKRHMNKDVAKTTDDAEMAGFIGAACQMIEERVGPVTPTAVTQTVWRHHHHASRRVVLDLHPVIDVTTVTVDGITVPEADPVAGTDGWVLDAGPGVLAHTRNWPWGRLEVTYRAGRTPLPGNIRLAALELTGHLWKQSQLNNNSTARPPAFGDDVTVMPGLTYALPIRVRELLGLGSNPTTEIVVG